MEECFLHCCSPFSNTLLLNSFMIRSTLVSLGSLQHYCWLHRNFPRRNKVPGKHFLIEIPLRKWCHSHSLEYAAQCNNNTMKYHKSPSYKCLANSSINPILCQTNTLPSQESLVRLSEHHHLPSFAQFETKL